MSPILVTLVHVSDHPVLTYFTIITDVVIVIEIRHVDISGSDCCHNVVISCVVPTPDLSLFVEICTLTVTV